MSDSKSVNRPVDKPPLSRPAPPVDEITIIEDDDILPASMPISKAAVEDVEAASVAPKAETKRSSKLEAVVDVSGQLLSAAASTSTLSTQPPSNHAPSARPAAHPPAARSSAARPVTHPPVAPAPSPSSNPPSTDPSSAVPHVEDPPAPPEPRKPPEWKVLEPEDPSDPVEHEEYFMKRYHEVWKVVAASVRGKLHAHTAKWRDDAFKVDAIDGWTILIVSDGAGGSSLSRLGARIACDEAMKAAKELFDGYRLAPSKGETPDTRELVRLRTFLAEAARKAQIGILRKVQERKVQPRDLNATFLMVVHCDWQGRDFMASIQIGDGAVGAYLEDGTCALLGIADHGEFSAETRFLTTPGIQFEFDQRVIFCCKKGVRCLAVMCDGISDDFFPEDKRLVELFRGDPIADMKTKAGEAVRGVMVDLLTKNTEGGKALLEWMRYEKKQSSDDRTLILMFRSE